MTLGVKDTKTTIGHFGLMSNGAITRREGWRDGTIMALVRFLHPELFKKLILYLSPPPVYH